MLSSLALEDARVGDDEEGGDEGRGVVPKTRGREVVGWDVRRGGGGEVVGNVVGRGEGVERTVLSRRRDAGEVFGRAGAGVETGGDGAVFGRDVLVLGAGEG